MVESTHFRPLLAWERKISRGVGPSFSRGGGIQTIGQSFNDGLAGLLHVYC